MTRPSRILLEDILESIERIESYLAGVSKDQFLEDEEKQDALLRRLLVIAEAVKALPSSLRQTHSKVPWREIAGARDIVVHEYFRIDLELTWLRMTTGPRMDRCALAGAGGRLDAWIALLET